MRVAGEVLAKAASLAFFVVLARQLGREAFGTFAFALALSGALLIAAGFGTDDLVAREVARDRSRSGRDLADVVALKATSSAVLLVLALGIVSVAGYSAEARLVILLVGGGVALEVLSKSWHAIFQAHERLELVSACLVLQRVLTAAVAIPVLLTGGGLVAASAVYAGGALVGLLAAEFALRRVLGLRRARAIPAGSLGLLRQGVPIGVAGVLFTLLLRLDVTLLSFLAGNAAVGAYAAAFRPVEACQFLSWAFSAAMLPWLVRAGARGTATLSRGFVLGLKFEAALLAPVGLTFTCFAAPIVHLLYGHDYDGAITPLRLLGLAVVPYGLNAFSATVLIARNDAAALARIVGFVCVQNLLCNAVAIPLAGVDGAAAVATSSSVLLAVLAVRRAAQRTGGLQVGRAFAAPALAAAAMVAVAVLAPLPPVPAAALSLLAYGAVLVAVELALHADDARAYALAIPSSFRPRPASP